MKQITGAEGVIRSLQAEGVELVFGYPGGAIMPIYDALCMADPQLRHVLVRHEQGAVHAAEGYARVTGAVGVCFATSGPGATNLITGITDAMLDSVPLVCITGQVSAHLLGTDAFQEADIMGMTVPITKWNYQITQAAEIPKMLAKAFYMARTGRPGPVLIDITKDAQFELFDYHYQLFIPEYKTHKPRPHVDTLLISQAATLINNAKKPYLFVGQGVTISHAEQEVIALAEKNNIPVASTLLGLSAVPTRHPLYVGLLGMHGNYATNVLTDETDVVIAVGMRFDDRVTGAVEKFLPHAKVIHIDIDYAEFNKVIHAEVALHADAKQALSALLEQVEVKNRDSWLQQFKELHKQEYDQVIQASTHPKSGSIKMAEVMTALSEITKGAAVIVTDVGQHQMIAARYYHFREQGSHITSGGLGTMGFALPASIGAQMGAPTRDVIMIAGDGGFQMNIQELAVISQEQLPLKMIILNNGHLGMVRQWQELFFEKRYSFVKLHNPDFITIAKGYSIAGESISERSQLQEGLIHLLKSEEAFLLEVVVENEENVFPMVPTGCGSSEIRLT